MSEQYPSQEQTPQRIVSALGQLPLAYGLEFAWGGFAVTKEADEFYGLQVASVDAKISPEQFQQIAHIDKNHNIRPRIIMATPHELPHSKDADQSVRVVAYGDESDALTIWVSHCDTPEERRRMFWQGCVDVAKKKLGFESLSNEEIAQRIAYESPDDTVLMLNEVTAKHAARMQLTDMAAAAADVLPDNAAALTARVHEKRFARVVRTAGAALLASVGLVGGATATVVPGESVPIMAAKAIFPVGLLAIASRRLFKVQRSFNAQLIESAVAATNYWQVVTRGISEDIEAAYSSYGFDKQMRQMLGDS